MLFYSPAVVLIFTILLPVSFQLSSELHSISDIQNENSNNTFLFSVIIPLYQTERYLRDCLNSVIKQTIGFERNIEIIIVNDGSTDNSEYICLEYQMKYPNNIQYIRKEHNGVSSARNEGMKYIRGKYVNFMDSDDKWDLRAFEKVYSFFESNYEEIDIVSCRIKFFESSKSYHMLDYKYRKTTVVDLLEEPSYIEMAVNHVFIKSSEIQNLHFPEGVEIGEDTLFINSILLRKCKIGLHRIRYFYRKRRDFSSALQNSGQKLSYYTKTPTFVHQALFSLSKQLYGRVLTFIQYSVMYDLQWRIRENRVKQLNEVEKKDYLKELNLLLQSIDDEIIYKQKYIDETIKMACLSQKYGKNISDEITYQNGQLMFHNISLYSFQQETHLIEWTIIDVMDGVLFLEGKDNFWIDSSLYNYSVTNGNQIFYPNISNCTFLNREWLFGIAKEGRSLSCSIPLQQITKEIIQFNLHCFDRVQQINVSYGKFSHLPTTDNAYFAVGKVILTTNSQKIIINPYSWKLHIKREFTYLINLSLKRKYHVITLRVFYWLLLNNKKNEWLISDRINKANDNGEHIYNYIQDSKLKVECFYCISSKTSDYIRLKRNGRILPFDSLRYKLHFLLADKVISSHADEFYINPFGKDIHYLRDLLQFDYVFLQHGINQNDLSGWLHKFNKNIKLFLTATKSEFKSISSGLYGYGSREVKLLGFPRYDNLMKLQREKSKGNKEKILLISPTWRKQLIPPRIFKVGSENLVPDFNRSRFFTFYNTLLSNKTLISIMKQYNYRGIVALHPAFIGNSIYFSSNDIFHVQSEILDYQKAFIESSIMVTDYSSVAFDFAFLHKPVIYSQFDEDEMCLDHIYKPGYFNYFRDGFGPVCNDVNSTVDAVINTIKNNSSMDSFYRNRVDSTFVFFDSNNCQRTVKAIMDLPNKTRVQLEIPKKLQLFIILIVLFLYFRFFIFQSYCFREVKRGSSEKGC